MAAHLAARIRTAAVSDEYDLASFTPAACAELVAAAFGGAPIECSAPFRVTLVCGGGKGVRQKYHESMPRDLAAALLVAGYREDRGAHVHASCAGSFKHQHDVDKNLLFVHVFPRIALAPETDEAAAAASASSSPASPTAMVLAASTADFQRMVATRLVSLSQKKAAHRLLRDAAAALAGAEAKLVAMQALSADEQRAYDDAAAERAVECAEKAAWLATQMEAQCAAGPLTAAEQAEMAASMAAKLATLDAQLAASGGGAPKLVAARDALKQRHDALCALAPASAAATAAAVKRLPEYRQLRARLAELTAIETAKGLQSVETLQRLREKPSLVEALAEIEAANRGWFETDAAFDARWAAALKPAGGGAGSSSSSSSAGSSGGGVRISGASALKSKAKPSGSNMWSALADA